MKIVIYDTRHYEMVNVLFRIFNTNENHRHPQDTVDGKEDYWSSRRYDHKTQNCQDRIHKTLYKSVGGGSAMSPPSPAPSKSWAWASGAMRQSPGARAAMTFSMALDIGNSRFS